MYRRHRCGSVGVDFTALSYAALTLVASTPAATSKSMYALCALPIAPGSPFVSAAATARSSGCLAAASARAFANEAAALASSVCGAGLDASQRSHAPIVSSACACGTASCLRSNARTVSSCAGAEFGFSLESSSSLESSKARYAAQILCPSVKWRPASSNARS